MAREVTVILKKEPEATPSVGSRLWAGVNELVKSPLFVFVFGASVGTVYPIIKDWFTPQKNLAIQKSQEQAKADAAMIVPFIANLDASKPGQFEASRAALSELGKVAGIDENGKIRPIFEAVNKSIEVVGAQLRPLPARELSAEDNKQIETTAETVRPSSGAVSPMLSLLSKDTVVYVQVDKNNAMSQLQAEKIVSALRNASVLTPSIEKVTTAIMPKRTQVRYYHEEDKSKAEQLAALVLQVAGSEVQLAKPKLDAKTGTLEVWIGTGSTTQ